MVSVIHPRWVTLVATLAALTISACGLRRDNQDETAASIKVRRI